MKRPQSLVPGLVGMSVHTDCAYLQGINAAASQPVPQVSSIRILLQAIDFDGFTQAIQGDDFSPALRVLLEGSRALERAGADFLVVTSNTGGALLAQAGEDPPLPILDITRAVLSNAEEQGLTKLGLLSTSETARSGIYQARAADYGCTVINPPQEVAAKIDEMIFKRLIRGVLLDADLETIRRSVALFADAGADAVILGCTDITLFGDRLGADTTVPLLDSTVLHAMAIRYAADTGDLGKFAM